MEDPEQQPEWKRRGLVVGNVHSGKTATYAALICKAADAGYRMVILLTGMLENVRRQTQERLDAGFAGLDSRDYFTTGQLGRKRYIGVGLIDGRRDGIVFTSRDYDFRRATASALNISFNSIKEPDLSSPRKTRPSCNVWPHGFAISTPTSKAVLIFRSCLSTTKLTTLRSIRGLTRMRQQQSMRQSAIFSTCSDDQVM